MTTDGAMGEIPSWYKVIRAARYLNVAPWDLVERPFVWQTWAMGAEMAEIESSNQKQERESRRSRMG